jgi:ribosome-binding factor A
MPLGGKGAEGVTKALAAAKGEIRREVARAVNLKFAPDFRFHLDETFDQMDETRRLLSDEAVRRDLDD